jgi:hypothetical protein
VGTGARSNDLTPTLAPIGRHSGDGSWYFPVSVTSLMGRRERVRRGGYPTRAAARHARDEAMGRSREDQNSHAWTLERWLRYSLCTRVGIRPTTRLSHTHYIERFLIPHLGKIRLAELTARGLTAFFAAVTQGTNRFGQPHTPTTLAPIPRPQQTRVITAHRPSAGRPKRSPAVATARQPPSTQNSMNSYIRC